MGLLPVFLHVLGDKIFFDIEFEKVVGLVLEVIRPGILPAQGSLEPEELVEGLRVVDVVPPVVFSEFPEIFRIHIN